MQENVLQNRAWLVEELIRIAPSDQQLTDLRRILQELAPVSRSVEVFRQFAAAIEDVGRRMPSSGQLEALSAATEHLRAVMATPAELRTIDHTTRDLRERIPAVKQFGETERIAGDLVRRLGSAGHQDIRAAAGELARTLPTLARLSDIHEAVTRLDELMLDAARLEEIARRAEALRDLLPRLEEIRTLARAVDDLRRVSLTQAQIDALNRAAGELIAEMMRLRRDAAAAAPGAEGGAS